MHLIFTILPLFLLCTPTVCENAELKTLIDIKSSLDPHGTYLSSWTVNGDPCNGPTFEGVACNADGKVANISLQGKGLNGVLPSTIAKLKSLSGLYLHFNKLSGKIPKEIAELTLLTDLYLDVNNFTGSIPEHLGNMSNLQVLQLCYNKLSGKVPTQLGSLKKLNVLALQYNQLTGAIPASLGDLEGLTRLDLSFNNFFGSIPVKLAEAPHLRLLDVQNNTLSGNVPSALQRLNDGFQFKNNPGLCGAGFTSLRVCTYSDTHSPNKLDPFAAGSGGFAEKGIPESANLLPNCTKQQCLNHSKNSHINVIAGVIVIAIATVIGLSTFSWYRRKKQKIGNNLVNSDGQINSNQKDVKSASLISLEYSSRWDLLEKGSQEFFESCMFNLEDVESATQHFSEVNFLGRSNYSAVYKGVLRDGSIVAIKRIAKSNCKSDEVEFLKGLKILTSLQHGNVVRLRGFCCSKGRSECFLIYDFVPNGSLVQYLDLKDGDEKVFKWSTRVSIIKGIAKGIDYLHSPQGSKPALVHQIISAEKVLVDWHLNPLLVGSGLHKLLADDIVFSMLKASAAMGYLAPEYTTTGKFTDKSDIYAFGMLVFQILSGQTRFDPSTRQSAELGKLGEIIDPNLRDEYSETEAMKLGKLAVLCTHELPYQRPTINTVRQELSLLDESS
ncbi:cysteine-rich receptor-like protein kinase 15 isoform X1 [Silene latifolia]|uniref:cysteine-rich receptor-like protein kinase 15 isoform X1 n=1 Tax=Silene latifolia TaxID=37657 RepID=UPI003D76E43C